MSNYKDDIEFIKLKILTSKDSLFFGSILCNTEIVEDTTEKTLSTDGEKIYINVPFFESLNKEEKLGVIMHELWHIARLHCVDIKAKHQELWNIACDAVINSALRKNKFRLPKDSWYLNDIFDGDDNDKPEEIVYSELCKRADQGQRLSNSYNDLSGCHYPTTVIQKVAQAAATANSLNRRAGKAVPPQILNILEKHLKPKVDWKRLLRQYLTDHLDDTSTWKKRNRRYQNMYLPGKEPEEGRLDHLAYFIDVSGSISKKQIERITSEIFYIYKEIKPKKMTVIQFDTSIKKEDVINEYDEFIISEIYGRGGTSYDDVRDWIVKNKPTCSIIFTDLEAEPIEPVKESVIWIVLDNPNKNAEFGRNIHIENNL